MSYFDLSGYWKRKKALIDQALKKYFPPHRGQSSRLQQAIRYALFPGGKRLRPILTIAACETCGGKIEDVLQVACSIELIHNFSLIHDDLPALDNDDYRRGKLSCHRKFGEAIALLAGDALLAKAFELLISAPVKVRGEIAQAVGTEGLIGGEAEEIILNPKSKIRNSKFIKRIYLKKTGALIKAAVVCGGIVGGATGRQIQALRSYGEKFGLAFQIRDDILDSKGKDLLSWVKIFGPGAARRDLKRLIKEAKEKLSIFGKQARILNALAEFLK